MNLYVIRNSKVKLDRSLFSGSILGVASSACASCSSIGFLIISTFGGFGILTTDYLANYQTPLRIASIAILSGHYIQYIIRLQSHAFLIIDYPIKIEVYNSKNKDSWFQIQSKSKNQVQEIQRAANYYSPRLSITNRHLPSGCQRRTSADLEVVPTCLPSFIR